MLARVLLSAGLAFIISLIIGPGLIGFLTRLKFGQSIREEGPKHHQVKKGTPTMGGVMFLIAITVSTLIFSKNLTGLGIWALFATLGYGLIGFMDDYIKVVAKRNLGLKARQKFFGQILIALILSLLILVDKGTDTILSIPFTDVHIDLGKLYVAFAIFWMVGFSNAVNLTDGLDGLAAGLSTVAMTAYTVILYLSGDGDLAVFSSATAGACLGFLWFNSYPAQVIMGDTGALALGGALAAVSILAGEELSLLIIGGIFVIEVLSVMIQVASYKLTGKRVFKMSPIHHHFELSGWMETKVVARFMTVGIILGIIGVIGAIL